MIRRGCKICRKYFVVSARSPLLLRMPCNRRLNRLSENVGLDRDLSRRRVHHWANDSSGTDTQVVARIASCRRSDEPIESDSYIGCIEVLACQQFTAGRENGGHPPLSVQFGQRTHRRIWEPACRMTCTRISSCPSTSSCATSNRLNTAMPRKLANTKPANCCALA